MAGGNLIGLIEKIITSTPNCVRAVVSIVLLVGVAVVGLWWLNADVRIGPFDLTGREAPIMKSSQQCQPNDLSPGGLSSCAG